MIAIRASREETEEFDRAWKRTDNCLNRSQFVRKAINAYAGETIFAE